MEPFTSLVMLIVATSLALAFSGRQQRSTIDPQEFDEGSIPQVDEGTRIAEVFGDVNIDNWMVLGYGDFRNEPIRAKQLQGKKK